MLRACRSEAWIAELCIHLLFTATEILRRARDFVETIVVQLIRVWLEWVLGRIQTLFIIHFSVNFQNQFAMNYLQVVYLFLTFLTPPRI